MTLFHGGKLMITPGIINLLDENNQPINYLSDFINRHMSGDWGSVSDSDKTQNDLAVKAGNLRIFSAYRVCGCKVWIITEADRSATTILLPDEY